MMRRREFVVPVVCTAAMWPLSAEAQQKLRRMRAVSMPVVDSMWRKDW